MRRWIYLMLGLCVAAGPIGCAGDKTADTAKPAEPAAVGTAGTPAAKPDANREAAMADTDFVGEMLAGNRAEVDLGKLAQQKASNKQVKDFAAMMVRDHSKAGADLKTVATTANIDTSRSEPTVDPAKETRDRLAKLSGAEFDREYMKAMVEKHEKTADKVQAKADKADNDHIKQWAAKTLPTVKKHLEQAKEIQESLEKRSGT